MAKKFSIKRDPTFKATVNLPSPGQEPVPVEFTFKWMDRKELTKFNDDRYQFFVTKVPDYAKEEGVTGIDVAQFVIDYEVPQLRAIIAGWDIEEEFNDENLQALVEAGSELPAAIVNGYLASYDKAREGN
ncbi:MAG: hypothetical protein [Caudoviricetes sp.]|nr:MAG: hypothetical protein [Caudoviricetes sp.]